MTLPRCLHITTWTLVCGSLFWLGAIFGAAGNQPNVEIRRIQVPVTPAAQLIVGEEVGRICKARERSKKVTKL